MIVGNGIVRPLERIRPLVNDPVPSEPDRVEQVVRVRPHLVLEDGRPAQCVEQRCEDALWLVNLLRGDVEAIMCAHVPSDEPGMRDGSRTAVTSGGSGYSGWSARRSSRHPNSVGELPQ